MGKEHQPPLSEHLTFGFSVLEAMPTILQPLADEVVTSYQRHHPNLRSVYAIGSVAIGEWTEGVSDLDVVGVMENELILEDDTARRRELLKLGESWPQVSFVNNSALSLATLRMERPDAMAVGRAQIIAMTGLRLWGDQLDFHDYIPPVETLASERAKRAQILMNRYRSGMINEPFASNPHLLNRSSAKAAIRVLSGITILRGAVFYASPEKTVAMVATYAPEAVSLAQRALAIVNGTKAEPSEAIEIAEQTIELFRDLYPTLLPEESA